MNGVNDNSAIIVSDLRHSYTMGGRRLEILRGATCRIEKGKWICILGASGCGKTTLLNLIGGLEKPESGSIEVCGVDVSKLSRSGAAHFRSATIGFVFQSYHLLPELDILENVALAARIAGAGGRDAVKRARGLLETVGLGERLDHRPTELSGGEQQRAAIARALINDPQVLLADEPTGNLDAENGAEVLDLFDRIRKMRPELTILMITHNRDITPRADGVLLLKDGVLTPAAATPAAE